MAVVTSFDQLDLSESYTYQDYLSWRFQERVELFLGKVFKMSPAPNRYHQQISLNISTAFHVLLADRHCKLYTAPFDVRLPISKKDGNLDTVVLPDIVVICDPSKLDEQGCNGAPDVVVEILSPGNSTKEMKEKFELYEAAQIPEYWIVDPANQDIVIYALDDAMKYFGSKPFVADEEVCSSAVEGLCINAQDVFRN